MPVNTERTPLIRPSEAPAATRHYASLSRFVVYQAVAVLSAADSLLALFALDRLHKQQLVAAEYDTVIKFDDAWQAGFLLSVGGAAASAICGLAFIVMVCQPRLRETKATVIIKEIVFSLVLVALGAIMILATIVLATRSAHLDANHLTKKQTRELLARLGPLAYKKSPFAIAFVVIGWAMWLFLLLSLILVSLSGRYTLRHGPANTPKQLPERLADALLSWFGVRVVPAEE
ncbi:hypothetical protein OIV83_002590 [Microbotryomycetes sp. JL201]|nr:hypothetical protein OIV83_002590 [Microbotryomycetes sp. JL201]